MSKHGFNELDLQVRKIGAPAFEWLTGDTVIPFDTAMQIINRRCRGETEGVAGEWEYRTRDKGFFRRHWLDGFRPCWVWIDNILDQAGVSAWVPGHFHEWAHSSSGDTAAVIEIDGAVNKFPYSRVRFNEPATLPEENPEDVE